MTEKAKTGEKRNSFPGFSFFDGPSFALFLFLSCGDADVSSAFDLIVLVHCCPVKVPDDYYKV